MKGKQPNILPLAIGGNCCLTCVNLQHLFFKDHFKTANCCLTSVNLQPAKQWVNIGRLSSQQFRLRPWKYSGDYVGRVMIPWDASASSRLYRTRLKALANRGGVLCLVSSSNIVEAHLTSW